MIAANKISPRSFNLKKNSMEEWNIKEREDLTKLKENLLEGKMRLLKTLKKVKKDSLLAERYRRNDFTESEHSATIECSEASLYKMLLVS